MTAMPATIDASPVSGPVQARQPQAPTSGRPEADIAGRASGPRRPCAWPACPALVVRGQQRYCDRHAERAGRAEYDRRRLDPTQGKRFLNSAAWRRLSADVRREQPICSVCGAAWSVDIHHKLSRRERPDLALCRDNLIALCKACHAAIENSSAGRFVN